jgi:hypothetical protein
MESSFWSCSFAAGLDEVDDTQRIIKSEKKRWNVGLGTKGCRNCLPRARTRSTGDRDNIEMLKLAATGNRKNYQQVVVYAEYWKRQDKATEVKKFDSEFEHLTN